MEHAIKILLLEGGPMGLAVLGWAAWLYERKQHAMTIKALRELSVAQIEAAIKTETAIAGVTRIMDRLLNRRTP